MIRRSLMLGSLAAALPRVGLAKQNHKQKHKHQQVSAAAITGLTFATYTSDFTPGPEDVSIVGADGLVITLPDPTSNAGRELKIVGNGPSRSRSMQIRDADGSYFIQTPGVFVCDGVAWYLAANF